MSNVTDVDRPVIHIAGCDIPVDLLAAYTMMMVAAIGSIYVGSKSSLVSLLDSETEVKRFSCDRSPPFPPFFSLSTASVCLLSRSIRCFMVVCALWHARKSLNETTSVLTRFCIL